MILSQSNIDKLRTEFKDYVVIKNALKKNNAKFITKLRSLILISDMLNISIVKDGNTFKVKHNR